MSAQQDEGPDQRLEQLLDMVLQLAQGELGARVRPSARGDEIDSIATGMNMLAEELEASIAAERKVRAALEARVAERTRELEDKLSTIRAQAETIQELSTPVLKVWEGVLAMPLVGVLDTRRAQQMTEELLQAINQQQATVALVDITGVTVLDTRVADHLLDTMRAVSMLGADVILTGVGPVNAQTMVKLGIDVSELQTAGSLQSGLRKAIALTARDSQ
jgi:rsbT co-antagonist protein RsbR